MLRTAKLIEDLNIDKLLEVYSDILNERRKQDEFYLYLLDFFKEPNARYYVWDVDGQYCSALRMAPFKDGVLIAGLYTRDMYRNMGYAKCLLTAVCDTCDVPIYSHVEKRNIASMRTHLSCGFIKECNHAVFIDGSVSWNSITLSKK